MHCDQAQSLLFDYVDDHLPDQVRLDVGDHLETCTDCQLDYQGPAIPSKVMARPPCTELAAASHPRKIARRSALAMVPDTRQRHCAGTGRHGLFRSAHRRHCAGATSGGRRPR